MADENTPTDGEIEAAALRQFPDDYYVPDRDSVRLGFAAGAEWAIARLAAHEAEVRERIAQDIEAERARWAATSAVGTTAAYAHAARIARGATR